MGQHGGGIDGMSAMVGILPDQRSGSSVLSNLNGNQLPAALMFRVFDAYLGTPPRDWSAEFQGWSMPPPAPARQRRRREPKGIVTGPMPTLPLAGYIGTYRHPAWAMARVTSRTAASGFAYGTQSTASSSTSSTTLRGRWDNPARGTDYVNLTIDVRRQAASSISTSGSLLVRPRAMS